MQLRGTQLERGSLIGGYRIDELISRGGMGVVYRATNVALNRIYALKVLAPELADDERFRERFKREMRIAASLHHPNVVGIHYAGEQEGLLFFVMDFIAGHDLRDVLTKCGALDPERAVELLAQLASALDAAHKRGLVHRDVKPANVLLTVRDGEEHVYLTDFGVAKRFDTLGGLTAKGAVVGTVDYMSPEQINGGVTDARTDIYALGCVFFQMLTGNVPYERENSIAKLFAHVHDPPPPIEGSLAELYPTFGGVIEKAMAKDPDDRYLSAGDFARDAAAALKGTRYTGSPTVVATGEARPSSADRQMPTAPVPPPAAAETVAPAEPVRVEAAPPPPPEPVVERAPEPVAPEPVAPEPVAPAPVAPEPVAPAPVAPAPVAATADAGERAPRGSLIGFRRPAAGLVVIVAAAIVAVVLLSGSSKPPCAAPSCIRLAAAVNPVPTNRVTGSGHATVQLRGNTATVAVNTAGLLDGAAHAMHIHAGGQGVCPPASAAHPHNGHLSISTSDGLHWYGPPEASLTTFGDTSVKSIIDFSRYPHIGDISYTRTITIPPGVASAIRADDAVVVVHGIDYNGNGVYDDVLDRSELNNALPGEATAPALCGPLVATQTASGQTVYTASLHLYHASSSDQERQFLLLCHLLGISPGAVERQTAAGATAT